MRRTTTLGKGLLIGLLALAMSLGPSTPVSAGINAWTSLGPEGGWIYALAIDPTTPNTLYAGTSGGGMFKSTNGGTIWSAVNTGLTNLNVYALAMDSTMLYAGTYYGGAFSLQHR